MYEEKDEDVCFHLPIMYRFTMSELIEFTNFFEPLEKYFLYKSFLLKFENEFNCAIFFTNDDTLTLNFG